MDSKQNTADRSCRLVIVVVTDDITRTQSERSVHDCSDVAEHSQSFLS